MCVTLAIPCFPHPLSLESSIGTVIPNVCVTPSHCIPKDNLEIYNSGIGEEEVTSKTGETELKTS